MKKSTILGATVILGAGALVAMKLLGKREDEPSADAGAGPAEPERTVDPDKTIAFPLKNKYADYSRGENDPIYRFELETPNGVKEVVVAKADYETYYIGDEVVCLETGKGLEIV